jgi:DNA-binding SARP family transcriptional activator
MIAVRVFGALEVAVDGAPADLGGPRQRCVLARVTAEHGRAVPVDRLIEDVYASEAPPGALAAVQSYVSRLRDALEPGRTARTPARVLVTSPPGYALRLGRGEVDAWSFEEQVRHAAGLDDPAAVHDQLTTALASCRGDAFAEFAGLGWADLEASRLEELRLAAVERLAGADLRLGGASQVVADLSRLAAEHPLREEAWRLLALALYQCGRQGDALAALRRARAHLAEELGVDPGPALRTLEDDILAQAPHLSVPSGEPWTRAPGPLVAAASVSLAASDPGIAGTPGASAAAAPEPFVGRDAELALTLRAATEAAAGRMRIVLVTGDAGAGKTALADQVRRRLAAQGWVTVTGRCREDEGAPPGWPWAEALRQLPATVPSQPESLRPLLAESPPSDGDAPAARFRLHRAITGYLDAVSATAPLLVVLDDLHRADGETLAILAGASADLTASRVLVLTTCRPGEAGEPLTDVLAALASREPARVALGGLDTAAAAELIRAICLRPVDEATTRLIAERTGGNPFFLKETARLVDSEGELAATTGVPAGVADVLARRIARLPASAQTILRQAAVIGTETSFDVLADVSGEADDLVVDAIEAGLLTGLITEPAAGRIRFAHALVRDTLYQGLSRLRRARLHARAAEAIERHDPAAVAALAHHFAEAGADPAVASRYYRLAAQQAEQRFGYREAARLWERAISCLDQAASADVRDRLELVLGVIGALANSGQPARARSWRQDAIRVARPLGDPVLLARVITASDVPALWSVHEYGVTDYELVEAVEHTLTRLPSDDPVLRCRLLTTLALEVDGTESERGYQASTEAVELARRLDDPIAAPMAMIGRYLQSYRHDGLDERFRLGAELLALPGKPVTTEALAHLMLMRANCGLARFDEADRHADQAEQIAARYDLPWIAASMLGFYRAMRAALANHPDAAESYQRAAAEMNRLGMWQHGAALSLLGRFCLLAAQDKLAEIIPELEAIYNYPPWSGPAAEPYALSLAAAGRTAEARAAAGEARPIRPDSFWLFMTGVRGMLATAIGDRDRAASAYRELQPYAARPAGADSGLLTLWPTALILGDLASDLGLPDADDHYRHALDVAAQANVEVWAEAARDRLRRSRGR